MRVPLVCMVLNVLNIESQSGHNTGSTRPQNPQGHNHSVQPAAPQGTGFVNSTQSISTGQQFQYQQQVQFRPVLTSDGRMPAGYSGTPSTGTPGLGSGVGGVQGQFRASECARTLPLQCLDTIQGPVCPRRLAVGPTRRKLLAQDSQPNTLSSIDL